MRNHWLNKSSFKKRIKKELIPILDMYHGNVFSNNTFQEIQDVISNWIRNLNQPSFGIDLSVFRVFDGYEEVIDRIMLEIID